MITFKQKGDFSKTEKFLKKNSSLNIDNILDKYGKMGVEALKSSTPVDTGLTANSWYYEIKREKDNVYINWCNSNINEGVLIAILLQYGHATGTGGYVIGKDYINPAIKPIFDEISYQIRKEINNS